MLRHHKTHLANAANENGLVRFEINGITLNQVISIIGQTETQHVMDYFIFLLLKLKYIVLQIK